MIVVLASKFDAAARSLVEAWKTRAAVRMMTTNDLSVAGWQIYATNTQRASLAVVEGSVISEDVITGVLTLLPSVFESELTHIEPNERPYVASEMQAFLIYWLSRLHCPVWNPPTTTSLSGPNWNTWQWRCAAARIGLRLSHTTAMSEFPDNYLRKGHRPSVVVVGDRILGGRPRLEPHARALAKKAKVKLLEVLFSGNEPEEFIEASPWVDFSKDDVREAIFSELCKY